MARRASLLLQFTLSSVLLAGAGAPVLASTEACTPLKGEARRYLDCLGTAQKASEARLQRAVLGARAAIEARTELQPVQRSRWAALLEEAEGRHVHWRNFECQSIAPYEGGGADRSVGGRIAGIGALEQRMVCLIRSNDSRATELEQRYTPPKEWLDRNPLQPPTETAGTPAATAPAIAIPETAARKGAGTMPRIIDLKP